MADKGIIKGTYRWLDEEFSSYDPDAEFNVEADFICEYKVEEKTVVDCEFHGMAPFVGKSLIKDEELPFHIYNVDVDEVIEFDEYPEERPPDLMLKKFSFTSRLNPEEITFGKELKKQAEEVIRKIITISDIDSYRTYQKRF